MRRGQTHTHSHADSVLLLVDWCLAFQASSYFPSLARACQSAAVISPIPSLAEQHVTWMSHRRSVACEIKALGLLRLPTSCFLRSSRSSLEHFTRGGWFRIISSTRHSASGKSYKHGETGGPETVPALRHAAPAANTLRKRTSLKASKKDTDSEALPSAARGLCF